MAFTYRTGLGRPLTWEEMDDNLAFIEQLEEQARLAAQDAATARDDAEGFRDDSSDFRDEARGHEEQAQIYAAAAQSAAGIPALEGNAGKALLVTPDETGVFFGGVVDLESEQTISNKTLAAPEVTGGIEVGGAVTGNVTATAEVINCAVGNYFTQTVDGNSTITFVDPPLGAYAFTLNLTLTSGVIVWPASVKWPEDLAPTLAVGKSHLLTFVTDDGGTQWRGVASTGYGA